MTATLIFSVFWLGILTAISPCPLATNIAAISFIGRKSNHKIYVVISGLFYSLGRIVAYIMLGIFITAGILGTSSDVSIFLQKYMNEALGPILILLGLILLGWIGSGLSLNLAKDNLQDKAQKGGLFWAVSIGFIFALSFCPVSAGLFFGGLLPLALKYESYFLLPFFYGIGTALPVIIFAFLIAFASSYVGKAFYRLTQIEFWIRQSTGVTFNLVGVYYCLVHIYGVFI